MDSFEPYIVLADDQVDRVVSLQQTLHASGYTVTHYNSPNDITPDTVVRPVSLILLADSDHANLWIASFRAKKACCVVPILMLCEKNDTWHDGVSDCLVWPCETKALLARIQPYTDLAQSRAAEAALRQSEASYREIFNASSNVIFIHDIETGCILSVNKTFESMYGYTCEEASEVTLIEGSSGEPPYTEEQIKVWMHRAIHEGPQLFEWHAKRKDGTLFWCEVSLRTVQIGVHTRLMAIVRDITQRKNAERSLVLYRDKLRSLASEMSMTEERQRRYIASCLHDGACQELALAILKLQTFQVSLGRQFGMPVTDVVEVLRDVVRDLRDLTFDLSPPVLYMSGLAAAVEELLEDQFRSHTEVKVHFFTSHQKCHVPEDLRSVLYQCVRELIVNIIKHAKATKVSVVMDKVDSAIQIEVKDNGVGFNVNQANVSCTRDRGFGLFNIAERLDYIGGTFHMESVVNQGSCFVMTAPY